MLLTALVLASLADSAVKPTKFDLVCEGTTETISLALISKTSEAFAMRLRIDLDDRKYCSDDCKIVSDIADVRPEYIAFEKSVTQPLPGQMMVVNQINRETGALVRYSKTNGLSVSTKATCEPQTFSGFPVPKTKF